MNFRFFDDLMDSTPGASQELRFREEKHSAKKLLSKDY